MFDDVDVIRKERKIDEIDSYSFAIRNLLDFHFYINGKTHENPYFKLDALVWSNIFKEKVYRYSDKVYLLSEYMMQHFHYINSLSFTQIEKGDFIWSANRIPFNYRDKVLRHNPPLSPEELDYEKASPFKVKRYHYSFRDDDELSEEYLRKTYINMQMRHHFAAKSKTVRDDVLNLDSENSKEKEEMVFALKAKLESMGELPLHNESFFSMISKGSENTRYSYWRHNLMNPLDTNLQELAERRV